MGRRTWPVFTVGLLSLLLLILIPGTTTIRRTNRIQQQIRTIQERFQSSERALDEINTRIHSVSISVRDFLLDSANTNGHDYRAEVLHSREVITARLADLSASLSPEDTGPFERMRSELERYWDSVLPVFDWTPAERAAKGTYFLRQQRRPRREHLLGITAELGSLNRSNFQRQYDGLEESLVEFRSDARNLLTIASLMGCGIALATALRISYLERKSNRQHAAAVAAEEQMRELSNRLMNAQEEERRVLSRELHDEVGQLLTGLRMELGAMERARTDEKRLLDHVHQAKEIADSTMRSVREIARGLRPALLDDLGLGAAIQWQARQFAKRADREVAVDLQVDADALADPHRTCLYRVLQEALTNCAKHADAGKVRVGLTGNEATIALTVADDGVGITGLENGSGLGLRGMTERVREVGGMLDITSAEGKGTVVRAEIPFVREQRAQT